MKSAFVVTALALAALPASAQVDPERAAQYFREAALLCEKDGGRLWGISLCGPMVIADAATGTIATNRPAPSEPRPRMLGFANAAIPWGNEIWSTYVWQYMPEDAHLRGVLLIHELFHRVQRELGLFLADSTNAHLDTFEGRYWLQLEWRALARALEADGEARTSALRDVFAFRARRHTLAPSAAEFERTLVLLEGLPQYTGIVVVAESPAQAARDAIANLERTATQESYVRTFAYGSGPAYGILLDALQPDWRTRLDATSDIALMLVEAAGVSAADDAEDASARYGGAELRAAEMRREDERRARVARLTAQFIDGPVIIVPAGRNASFVTSGMTPLGTHGTVYPTYRVSGEWGSLEAELALLSADRSQLTLPGPAQQSGTRVTGPGWTLELAEGWRLGPGPRSSDRRVQR